MRVLRKDEVDEALLVRQREEGSEEELGISCDLEQSVAALPATRNPAKIAVRVLLVAVVAVLVVGKLAAHQVQTSTNNDVVQLSRKAASNKTVSAHKKDDDDEKTTAKEAELEAANASAAVVATTTTEPCQTAEPGDGCYEAVLWHKWIGSIENPGAYPYGTWRGSDRRHIQHYLYNTSQGTCKKPCYDGKPYPLPAVAPKQSPSIYCFSVARVGPEMDTMFMQRQGGMGIFACDGYAVYSDADVDIEGLRTIIIGSTASGVSVDRTAANSQVFMRTWMTLLNNNDWWHYDFIAKVDPDAVLFPDRLRGHLAWHTGQDVFFLNCARYHAMMYGALEVFSKAALGTYLAGHWKCEQSLPYWSWGEDKYMGGCLEMLGVQTQADYSNFLHDERCWGVDCGNKAAVAFHAFKQVNSWYHCYLASK